jgi:hypothetical protein
MRWRCRSTRHEYEYRMNGFMHFSESAGVGFMRVYFHILALPMRVSHSLFSILSSLFLVSSRLVSSHLTVFP